MSSAITLADVAEYLAGAEANEGLGGWPGLHAKGNVVHITVKPVAETESDGENNEVPPEVHFEAHVFQVDPPAPVAAEPVELPADLARELANGDVGGTYEGWTVVVKSLVQSRQWRLFYRLVVRDAAGQHFEGTYRWYPTTQETEPHEYETVTGFVPVERQVKVVQTVKWVAAKAKTGGQE